MELEKLQEKGINESFLKILEIEFLEIMKDEEVDVKRKDLEGLNIKNMKYEFSVDAENFIRTISEFYNASTLEIKKELEYFKVHFMQDETNKLSIGFSLSSNEKYNGKNDSFYKTVLFETDELTEKHYILENIQEEEFEILTGFYKTKILPEIKTSTKTEKNTQLISYKIKDVYLFLINHFILNYKEDYTKLFFEVIKFEENPKDPNHKNKLSLVVRATNSSKGKTPAYDFGTVYP